MTTPTNSPARAATVGEKAKYRANRQWSEYGLAIHHPVTVYSARVNQTFATLDEVVQLTYDGGSGTLANVKEGMTVFIGSTAGARDKGVTVARKTPTSSILYIRPTSDIQFADNDHITVIDAFSLWSKPIFNRAGVVRMDYDIEYGSLTRGGFIPRLGPLAAVINQESGTITFTPPNPSLSAAYDGATLASLVFSAPGALTTSNMTSAANAQWTYPLTADGEYRWSCAITDSLGRVTTAYRRVFVNPTQIPFEVSGAPTGDLDTGNWSFEITAYADVSSIYDRAMVTLYFNDYHSGVVDNIGKLAGYENTPITGWIDGESIRQDSQTGLFSFTVQGPAFWMDKVYIDPLALTDTFNTPTAWTQIEEMTVDKALALMLYWMSTAPMFMDCFFTGDTQRVKSILISGGSLWSQIIALASDTIFAKPLVNTYGQLFVEVDQQIADSTARSSFPVVLDITSVDYEPPLDIDRSTAERTSMLQLSALQDSDGVTDIYIHARAPGNVSMNFGQMSAYENYIVADSAECRRIAGRLLAVENNEYEPITLVFPSSIRLFDITPRMVATMTTSSADNPRGIALTAQRLIPRSVAYRVENGVPKTEVTFEIEVTGVDGVDYHPPTAEDDNLDFGLDDIGDYNLDFPGIDDFFAETVPPEVTTPCNRALGNSFTLTWSPRVLTGSTSTRIARALFPCNVRATGGGAGDTKIIISDIAFGDADDHKTCYAVLEGTRVLTGTWVGNTITFSPVSDTEIDGFEIELDAGEGSVVSRYALGKFLETGNMGDPTTLCVAGNFYAIGPYTGYWDATFPPEVVGLRFYNFLISPGNSSYLSGVGQDGFGDFHLRYDTSFVGEYAERSDGVETFNPSTQEFETSGYYGRIYFEATGNHTPAKSSTLTLGSAYHDMKWALYEAQAIGRQLIIGNSTLYNVCAL